MRDLLDALDKEENVNSKWLKMEYSPNLEKILNGFEEFIETEKNKKMYEFPSYITGLKYAPTNNANEILQFCMHLEKYQNISSFETNSGIYISALMSKCTDNEIVIITTNLEKRINYIGKQKNRKITIHGNVGNNLGEFIEDSIIIIYGNVLNHLGFSMKKSKIHITGDAEINIGAQMEESKLIVNGNANRYAGIYMINSKLIINGYAERFVGEGMENSRIWLNGDYGGISNRINSGCIYHRRKLILKKL